MKEAGPSHDSENLTDSGLISVVINDVPRDANEDQSDHSKFEPVDKNEGEAGHDEKVHEDIHATLPDLVDCAQGCNLG